MGAPFQPRADLHAGPTLLGIFVGGASRRMGSPKGLLRIGGEPLVERWLRVGRSLGLQPVLVGRHPAYAHLEAPVLDDPARGLGPAGGLLSLLGEAGERRAISVACDMPFVSETLLGRLLHELGKLDERSGALAPRVHGRWEPFLAGYAPARALPLLTARIAGGAHDLQGLLSALGSAELSLSEAEERELRDWDCPEDMEKADEAENTRKLS